jgi:hypothetical protein
MAIHYIVGVGTYPMTGKNPGERYLDFMLTYKDEEVEKVKLAKSMSENKMWKTKTDVALDACGVLGLAQSFAAIKIRANYSQLMICHFTSEDDLEFTREDLELIVKYKPLNELKEAQLKV